MAHSSAQSAALFFRKDGFDTSGKRLLGRQAAGEGFLRALVQRGKSDDVYCYAPSRADFQEFCNFAKPVARKHQRFHWLDERNPTLLSKAGALFRPDTMIGELAYQRRSIDPRAYSICGITHTIASRHPQRAIADMLTAPLERWDALICTSTAVRRTAQNILDGYAEYLAERCGARPALEVKLPVIPLGVETRSMPHGADAASARATLRNKLEMADDDIALLFMGRLVFYAKAHPIPMYLAAERAAQASGKRLVLLMTGWFEHEHEEAEFKAQAAKLCPSVRTLFLDGREQEIRKNVWAASDIFVSLSDNIQETFGLTPIEAMAAGLPVVVSDWDGYRETVRDGIEGLRVPTVLPPAGAARDIASLFGVETIDYSNYIANLSLSTAVDVDACAKALTRLAQDPNLRKQLGENGRQRALSTYDWSVVVKAYEELWLELAGLRSAGPAKFAPKGRISNPLVPDPFEIYGHYATHVLAGTDRLALGAEHGSVPALSGSLMTRYGANLRAPISFAEALVARLEAGQSLSVSEILEAQPKDAWQVTLRSLGYLLKFDIIRLVNEGAR